LIPPRPAPAGDRAWRGRGRDLLLQVVLLAAIAGALWLLATVTASHMRARGIRSGFDFLLDQAGFDIGEGWLAFDAAQPYWRAFLAGLANTVRAAIPALVGCTVLGFAIGIGRLAPNPLVRGLCRAWVEALRNVPLLLQLLAWYLLLTEYLPDAAEPAGWPGIALLSKAGLALGGESGPLLSPEYLAVVLGLAAYTSAYVAEVVRAGLQAVPAGQREAAAALGLPSPAALRRVVLPQALRLVVPPLTNQYLNLVKNSSLAVAVGYPDLVSVANTAINQSGRAVECIAVLIAVYLALSLLTAALMGRLNRRTLRYGG
jgi:general L-amino acid transport system permease protein